MPNIHRNHIEKVDYDWYNLVNTLRALHVAGNSISELGNDKDEITANMSPFESTDYASLPSSTTVTTILSAQHDIYAWNSAQNQPSSRPNAPTFSKFKKLTWLDVSDNRISHVTVNFLPAQIITLNLSDNLLTKVPVNIFGRLHQLRSILLKNNLITSLENIEQIDTNVALERFDVSFNAIEYLPMTFFTENSTIKVLLFEKNLLKTIQNYAFVNTSATRISFAFNDIDAVERHAFDGLEQSLEYLDFESNKLTTIPQAVLALKQLNYLFLPSNRISDIDQLPKSLRALSLAGNNLTTIPVNGLRHCINLIYLNIGYNSIVDLSENMFIEWGKRIETLFLRNNKITTLKIDTFNGLESIKELSLSFNDIHFIHPQIFENISQTLNIFEMSFGLYRDDFPVEQLRGLTQIMWLSLDNNNLKKISDDSLITFSELVHIDLSFNRILMFPPTIFIAEIHKKLKEVDLSYNSLINIYTNTFDSLINLRSVRLSSNRLTSIDMHSFHNLPLLNYVDLTHNLLYNISENVFTFLPRLLQLDLQFNRLESLTLKIFKHATNESEPLHLNISHNRLTTLDGEINSFLYIYSIDATSNCLNDSQSFRHLGYSLRVLILRQNCFVALNNQAFSELYKMEYLDMSYNNLTLLRRRCFHGLTGLQRLDLSHNHISQLQVNQFTDLRNLRILNLANNRLRSLPREIFLNTRIEYLDLSKNFLTLWPANTLSDIGFTLRYINMATNAIEYLESQMFLNTQYIYSLDLSHNKLDVIPDNTFKYLFNLTHLDLSNNSLVTANLEQILVHPLSLRVLRLRSMGIYNMPRLHKLTELVDLDVSQNNLLEIVPLTHMLHLRKFSIGQNKIANFTALTLRLPASVRILNITQNPIRFTTLNDFWHLRRLEEFNIIGCTFNNIKLFAALKNLKVFHLNADARYNAILSKMYGLHELYVVVNERKFDGTFFNQLKNHTKIKLIEITGKKLSHISVNAFNGLRRCYRLHLRIRNTNINEFPPMIFYSLRNIPHLALDLSHNKINSFAPESFYPNASAWDAVGTRGIIGGIDVSENPLQCECNLIWLGHWQRRWLREISHIHSLSDSDVRKMISVSLFFCISSKFQFRFRDFFAISKCVIEFPIVIFFFFFCSLFALFLSFSFLFSILTAARTEKLVYRSTDWHRNANFGNIFRRSSVSRQCS